jgi:hypothetical protein
VSLYESKSCWNHLITFINKLCDKQSWVQLKMIYYGWCRSHLEKEFSVLNFMLKAGCSLDLYREHDWEWKECQMWAYDNILLHRLSHLPWTPHSLESLWWLMFSLCWGTSSSYWWSGWILTSTHPCTTSSPTCPSWERWFFHTFFCIYLCCVMCVWEREKERERERERERD